MRIGLIADTHGFLAPDALEALAGCEHIVHAGDIGPGVLEPLGKLGPVTAVRGNNDTRGAESLLLATERLELQGHCIVVVHRLAEEPRGEEDIVVFGHCHRKHAYFEGGRLYVNPGAAGRRGFHRERSVALLDLVEGSEPQVRFIDLVPRASLGGVPAGSHGA